MEYLGKLYGAGLLPTRLGAVVMVVVMVMATVQAVGKACCW